MTRFVALALPLLVLTLGLFAFALEALGLQASPGTFAAGRELPPLYVLGTWALEAMGLTALFLLIQGRTAAGLLDGLLAGWIAWIFRGPLLVLTVAASTRLPTEPWWALALRWLAAYTLCGLLLAALARRLRLTAEG